MIIKVGISNHHVHLTKESYAYLFKNKEIEVRNPLNQVGEFASTDTVTLKYDAKTIDHVRVVGPFRNHNQIELLKSDLDYLGLNAPIRRSGDLEDTPSIEIWVDECHIATDGVIRSERHVHVPTKEADTLGLYERDIVKLSAPKGDFYANVKVSDNGYFELHIDKDEAIEFGLSSNDELELTPNGELK